jgi:hypothetical protein
LENPWTNDNLQAPAGQYRVIVFDRFKGLPDEEIVGDFPTLDAAIEAANGETDPWYAAYVYDDDGDCVWSHLGPAISGRKLQK